MGAPPSTQPFARGQGQPFQAGPWLGGEIFILGSNVAAAGTVVLTHNLRVLPRSIQVLQPILGEYPSRLAITVSSTASLTVKFESAQSANAVLWCF